MFFFRNCSHIHGTRDLIYYQDKNSIQLLSLVLKTVVKYEITFRQLIIFIIQHIFWEYRLMLFSNRI